MLDWEEGIFRTGRAIVNVVWNRPRQKPFQLAEVSLESIRLELYYYAHLLAGQSLSIFETDESILRVGHRICLPPKCSLHTTKELNLDYYYLKTGMGALSLREDAKLKGLGNQERIEIITKYIRDEFPGLHEKLSLQKAALPENFLFEKHFGELRMGSPLDAISGKNETDDPGRDENERQPTDPNATEIVGKGRTQVDVLIGEDIKAPDVPQHTFEKVETLEEFEGLDRQLDGADDLKEHEEALNELDMRHVIRSKDRSSSIYRADIMLSPFELESRNASPNLGIPYPEWDFRKRDYKQDWCWIQVKDFDQKDETWAEAARKKHDTRIHALKRKLEQFSTNFLRARAQPTGDEFDVEAIVDARIAIKCGIAPSENIYTYRRRDLADVATLILVDLSDSTDAWVKGEHVLETLKGALFCLGEALEGYTHSFAIAGFASDTRRACSYIPIKDFETEWHEAIPKLGALVPQGYTRMGPAVRHATRILERQGARKKAILLISDGKPCDYDTYEGHYGIKDVKRAFNEAQNKGILTHAFAVDHKAREYFPAMFEPRNYSVIGEPKDLADAIFRFFMALKAET